MVSTIYKYNLEMASFHKIKMPKGATILHFGNQFGQPKIWAEVNPSEEEEETREFFMLGTGHDIPMEINVRYIGTAHFNEGALIFHLYEMEKENVQPV